MEDLVKAPADSALRSDWKRLEAIADAFAEEYTEEYAEAWGVFAEAYAKGYAAGYAKGYAEGLLEGRIEQARHMLLRTATKRFGPPSESIPAQIDAMTDLARLRDLVERTLTANDWADLLADPPPEP